MALESVSQFKHIIERSKNVLFVLGQNPSQDVILAARAAALFLEKKGLETATVFSDEFKTEEMLDFLPRPKNVSAEISGIQDFVLLFNTEYNKIVDVKTEFGKNELKVYITPEKGFIDPRDFSFIPSRFKFDLVISIGSPDKESLGKIYEENPDIFYEVPVVNIDNHVANENFGQLNIVSLTAASLSEIVFEALRGTDEKLIEADIASCLLAGIISATDSFQKRNTTPKSMQLAADLMDKGADQQKIVRYLYKTHPLHILKLWGRVMARLNWDEELKLAWSLVGAEDFVQSRSTLRDIPTILEKIKDNYSAGNIFFVLYNETADSVGCMLRASSQEILMNLKNVLGGEIKGELLEFALEKKNILEAEREVLEKIKEVRK